MFYYLEKGKEGFIASSIERPDLSESHDEVDAAYYRQFKEDKSKRIREEEVEYHKSIQEANKPETTTTDVEGLSIEIAKDNNAINIQIASKYIDEYKDEKELIELGELSSTTITDAQYKGLLKLRVDWRKELP